MADFADDFDEAPDDDVPGPILPPEDRLWRHPSELYKTDAANLDPVAVRRRWIQTQPTRASAWTAGLVGALLASGLVILGTHLAGALAGDALPKTPTLSSISVTQNAPSSNTAPAMSGFGVSITHAVSDIAKAVVQVRVAVDESQTQDLGLVVNSAGFILIPAPTPGDVSSVLVTLKSGVEYVGEVVSSDARLGVALIHINGANGLSTATFAKTKASTSETLAVAITSATGKTEVGSLHHLSQPPLFNASPITDALTTDLNPVSTPAGTVLLNGDGHISGIVLGTSGSRLIVSPGSLLYTAVNSLLSLRVLSTRAIGVSCTTIGPADSIPAGAQIRSITVGSAAASAGLRKGDVIVGVNGMTVISSVSFSNALHGASPRSPLVLTVYSGTTSHTVVIPASVATSP